MYPVIVVLAVFFIFTLVVVYLKNLDVNALKVENDLLYSELTILQKVVSQLSKDFDLKGEDVDNAIKQVLLEDKFPPCNCNHDCNK